MIKFLLDANLSPIAASCLRKLKFDTRSITEANLGHLKDIEVVKIAKREKRIIITFDLDFGEIYHRSEQGNVGIVVLRLKNQTPENVNYVLGQFLSQNTEKLKENLQSLIIIKDKNIRFVKK